MQIPFLNWNVAPFDNAAILLEYANGRLVLSVIFTSVIILLLLLVLLIHCKDMTTYSYIQIIDVK